MSDGASFALPGWYPDPADDERLRRWDGTQWTQDVILAPQDSPVGFVPPPIVPAPTASFAPPAADPARAQSTPPPPSPAVSTPPPPVAPATPSPTARTSSPAAAPGPTPPPAATSGASTPPQHPATAMPKSDPPSGPVSLPEWATLPGLTLPPDLSGIPGLAPDSVLSAPTFADPEPEPEPAPAARAPFLPKPDWSQSSPPGPAAAPASPPPPPPASPAPSAQDFPPPPPPRRGPIPAEHYAPPPAGAHYDVPPPPGASSAPAAGLALPASSLVSARMPTAAWSSGPVIEQGGLPPLDFDSLPRTSAQSELQDVASGAPTLWTWLIALLPLIQFAVVYLVFTELGVTFAPGEQWGILLAPAVLSLLCASGDRRRLNDLGVARVPSPLLAIVPPVYLLVRTVDVGRASLGPLIVWVLLQAAAIAGVFFLMPHILAQAMAAS